MFKDIQFFNQVKIQQYIPSESEIWEPMYYVYGLTTNKWLDREV